MKKIFLLAMLTVLGVTTSNAQVKKKVVKKAKTTTTKVISGSPVAAKIESSKSEGAGMTYENETIDYGTIQHNADGKREFVFTNTGSKPLIITNATGSCGCTVPSFPKEPIAPGSKAVIGVKYATDRVGAFTKTVTVTSNAVGANVTPSTTPSTTPGGAPVPNGQSTKVLTIKGTVLGDETPKETPKG